MKAKIGVGFSAKFQVTQFNPVEENDFIELEIEYETEEELEAKIKKWQKFIQERVLEGLKSGTVKYKESLSKFKD